MSAVGLRLAVICVHSCPLAMPGGKETGGMNIYVRELAAELGRRGVASDIFTRRHGGDCATIEPFAANARVIHLPAGDPEATPKEELFGFMPDFLRRVEAFAQVQPQRYDLVHSHYWLSGWVGGRLVERLGVPHVVMFHTLGEVKNRARLGEREGQLRIDVERRLIATADAVVAASPQERVQMQRLYDASLSAVAVIPCGVDTERFRPADKAAARRVLGLDGAKVVLFVGRIAPLKGIDTLLEAVALLGPPLAGEDVRLVVVGGDEASRGEIVRLEQRAVELDIGGRVRFVGAVAHEALPDYYNAADVCVVPSYHESFGMVAVEAMACGVPVVASRVGGLISTVREGETGYLIPWRCPEAFAERLELLLNNESLRDGLGRAAQQAALSLSWDRIADQVESLYRGLLAPAAVGAGAFA